MDDKPENTDSDILDELETDSGAQDELGQEDVGSKDAPASELTEINRVTGRKFGSVDEFEKHYKNLNSLVGDQTRVENERKAKELEAIKSQETTPELAQRLASLEAQIVEKDFLANNPIAASSLDLVKAVATSNGMTYQEAWDSKVKEVAEAAEAHKSEKEIGIRSKSRINPLQDKDLNSLAEQVRKGEGGQEARDQLIRGWLGIK
jgi:hypothetical protein